MNTASRKIAMPSGQYGMSKLHTSDDVSTTDNPTRPAVITRVVPSFATSLTLEPEPITSPKASGTIAQPASSAEYPRASWRNWVRAKIPPNSANEASPIAPDATEKRGSRKNDRFSMGWLVRSSQTTNSAESSVPAANADSTTGSGQPVWGASMIAYTWPPSAPIDSPAPIPS